MRCQVTGFECITCDDECDLEKRMVREVEQARNGDERFKTLAQVRHELEQKRRVN